MCAKLLVTFCFSKLHYLEKKHILSIGTSVTNEYLKFAFIQNKINVLGITKIIFFFVQNDAYFTIEGNKILFFHLLPKTNYQISYLFYLLCTFI